MKAIVNIEEYTKTKEIIQDFKLEDLLRLLKKHISVSISLRIRGKDDDDLDYYDFKEELKIGEKYLTIGACARE